MIHDAAGGLGEGHAMPEGARGVLAVDRDPEPGDASQSTADLRAIRRVGRRKPGTRERAMERAVGESMKEAAVGGVQHIHPLDPYRPRRPVGDVKHVGERHGADDRSRDGRLWDPDFDRRREPGRTL
jgi:hypothetical protein